MDNHNAILFRFCNGMDKHGMLAFACKQFLNIFSKKKIVAVHQEEACIAKQISCRLECISSSSLFFLHNHFDDKIKFFLMLLDPGRNHFFFVAHNKNDYVLGQGASEKI